MMTWCLSFISQEELLGNKGEALWLQEDPLQEDLFRELGFQSFQKKKLNINNSKDKDFPENKHSQNNKDNNKDQQNKNPYKNKENKETKDQDDEFFFSLPFIDSCAEEFSKNLKPSKKQEKKQENKNIDSNQEFSNSLKLHHLSSTLLPEEKPWGYLEPLEVPSLKLLRDFLETLCRENFGEDIFQDWLGHLFPLSWEKGVFTLGVASSFLRHWIELHYLESLGTLLKKEYEKEKQQLGSSLFSKIFYPHYIDKNLLPSGSLGYKLQGGKKKITPTEKNLCPPHGHFSLKLENSLQEESLVQRLSLGMGGCLPHLDQVRLVTLLPEEAKKQGYPLQELCLHGYQQQEAEDSHDISPLEQNPENPRVALPGFEDFDSLESKEKSLSSRRRRKSQDSQEKNFQESYCFLQKSSSQQWNHGHVDPLLTFDTFVVGEPNEFAYLSSKKIGEQNHMTYNPFFLYGPVGHGKTHLMQSIANKTKEIFGPKKNILYLSAEQFMYDFIRALRYGTIIDFKERFRHIHMLLLDDFQFIGGKEATQEEFFHIFNFLMDSKRQLIISADKAPKDLKGIQERMRSRLGWGLMANLQPTTYDLRFNILQKKALEKNLLLSQEILEFLAHHLDSNVRQLEGALTRLKAQEDFALCTPTSWTLDLVGFLLKDMFSLREDQQQKTQENSLGSSPLSLSSASRKKKKTLLLEDSIPQEKTKALTTPSKGSLLPNLPQEMLDTMKLDNKMPSKMMSDKMMPDTINRTIFRNPTNKNNDRNNVVHSIPSLSSTSPCHHGPTFSPSFTPYESFSSLSPKNFFLKKNSISKISSRPSSLVAPYVYSLSRSSTTAFSLQEPLLTFSPSFPPSSQEYQGISQGSSTNCSLDLIVYHVGQCFNIHPKDLSSSRRQCRFVKPRQIAMFLGKVLTPCSLSFIGRYFGNRNHTTVLRNIDSVEDLRQKDEQFSAFLEDLKKEILTHHQQRGCQKKKQK